MNDIKENKTLPRRWFPLFYLDWYILREFLIKYSILLLIFAMIFTLGEVYRYFSDFLASETGDLNDLALYLAYKLPGSIRFVLPISMLLGCMWTMASFGKNLEITAMRASGVSLFRCAGTIIAMGVVVTGINVYFNELLVPYSENMAETIKEKAVHNRLPVTYLLAYSSNDTKRRWLFESFNEGGEQSNVTLKGYWTLGMINHFFVTPKDSEIFENVKKVFTYQANDILKLPRNEMLEKIKNLLDSRKVDIQAKKTKYNENSKDWTFNKALLLSYDRNDETKFQASQGVSTMHEPILIEELKFSKSEIPESPDDIINSIKEKDELPSWVIWELVKRSPNMAEQIKVIYLSVFYYRLAFPWACLIAVFLGIPLATKNERTGSLMAIITAVILIVGYIVMAQVFLILGKGGIIDPLIAGLAPTILFIFCGTFKILFDRN